VVAISPAGLQHRRERGWGRSMLLTMRWGARNLLPPDPLLRTLVGRVLFAGPVVARPWRLDPNDFPEVLHLFAEAPGFEATLLHTFGGRPRGLNELDVPVTILWGTRDLLLLPRQAKRFERLIPNAELRYLKGLGHTPMSDDPELLAELIATTSRAPRAEAPA
jgi:pimeloyl-ACP methyl ester carboxylesterase